MTIPVQSVPLDPSGVQDKFQRQEPQGVYWEKRSSWLDLAAYWRTSISILFNPSATFTGLNYSTGIRSSLVYALVYGSLGQIIGRFWFTLIAIHNGVLTGDAFDNTMRFGGAALLTPILLVLFIFFAASLVHLALRLLFSARRSFSATFQVIAYTFGATSLINIIPFVGRFLMPIWALVLCFVGLTKAHQTSKIKAFFALLLPLVLTGFLIAGLLLVATVMDILDFLTTIDQ
jgi:hypothetical protein